MPRRLVETTAAMASSLGPDDLPLQRIHDDLAGVVRGELLFDEISRGLYSTDASLFRVRPLGVICPRDEADVQAIVRYAAERQVPLIARGAGTGPAGGSLGTGLVLDFSHHFRSVLEIGADSVRVQPGVTWAELNVQLARNGQRFVPEPANPVAGTIGGLVAIDGGGLRTAHFGTARDHLRAARVVLDNGDAVAVATEPPRLPPPTPEEESAGASARLRWIVRAASGLLSAAPSGPDRGGYRRAGALGPDGLHLPRLLAGSEGTLALFTELTLATQPLPGGRAALLFGFATLDAALYAGQETAVAGVTACELLDRRLLSLARSQSPDYARLVPAAAEAVLLVELEADSFAAARQSALDISERLHRAARPSLLAPPADDPDAVERLWGLRAAALTSLAGLNRGSRPAPLIEDVTVPLPKLPAFVARVQEALQRHEVSAAFLVHAAAGQVETWPFLDSSQPHELGRLQALAVEVHALALEAGGTVGNRYGLGLARTPWLVRQAGRLYPVLRELKRIFDPQGLFNPGKVIAEPVSSNGVALALVPTPQADQPERTALRWQAGELAAQVNACRGCGDCRATAPSGRMCPVFRATRAEAATPRAKANLLRDLLRADTGPRRLTADAVRAVADLCVNCKMCAAECSSHVAVPKLMLEAKAAHAAEHGLNRTEWVLARTANFAAFGSTFAPLINPLLNNRPTRWLVEKLFGISRRRRLPAFAVRNFLRIARRQGWSRNSAERGGRSAELNSLRAPRSALRVAYFVDTFATYNDPQIALAAVAVLHHNGIPVFVPPDQRGCGMAPLAQGDVDTAREVVLHNVRLLAELVREGYRVVCSEPTAALMFAQDALDLLDDPDARLVAENTIELTALLAELHEAGRLRTDFRPFDVSIGHHVPCHVKALGGPTAGPELLGLVPGLRVHTIDVSCSGMAGTYGLRADGYATSLAAGQPMLEEMGRPRVLFGSTECSSCRLQMEEGSGKRTLHPVQYLALAYGLMPELVRRLREPVRKLVLP